VPCCTLPVFYLESEAVAADKNDVHSVAPEVAVDFLKNIMPFDGLDEMTLHNLARYCTIDFYPEGTRILETGKTEITHLYLIQRGGVKTFIIDEQGDVTLKDYRGEGSVFGALGIIRGTKANLDVETVEDTFCFLLPKEVFLELINNQPGFAQYYLKSFSEKVVATAYNELRRHKCTRRGDDDVDLFTCRAGGLVKKTLRLVGEDLSVQECARVMAKHRVGSLLIHTAGKPDDIVGIITDKDLRIKVLAEGRDYTVPVREIMSSPVLKVLSETVCFDLLLKMMSTGTHHLAVERGNRIIGVVTSHDVMLHQGHSPYYLFKEIVSQDDFSGLYPLALKIPEMIRSLIREGGKAGKITQMIAVLNDHILDKLLDMLHEEMGPPPVRYCWLLMGSEGRREQTFRTDQDNAILYEDPENPAKQKEAEVYFREFSSRAIDHLVKCGYPLCPGDIMAKNPRWCQPYSVWRKYFEQWISAPDPQELLNAMIFFDFRAGYGDVSLAERLRDHLISFSKRHEIYLMHLARECMMSRVPLSFFKSFIVEKNGEHKDALDIKRQGLTPFVNFARVMSLKHGIKETNTLARLNVLKDDRYISLDLWSSARDAYELQMQMRLVHQLHQIENDQMPDNYLNPAQLTDLEKRMLKDAFSVIERLQANLKTQFPVV
jgi:CBS domain-containing protein